MLGPHPRSMCSKVVPPVPYQLLPAVSRRLCLSSRHHPVEQPTIDQWGPLGWLRSMPQGAFMCSDDPASWALASRWPRNELGPALVELESLHTGNAPWVLGQPRSIEHPLVLSVAAESLAAAMCPTRAGRDL